MLYLVSVLYIPFMRLFAYSIFYFRLSVILFMRSPPRACERAAMFLNFRLGFACSDVFRSSSRVARRRGECHSGCRSNFERNGKTERRRKKGSSERNFLARTTNEWKCMWKRKEARRARAKKENRKIVRSANANGDGRVLRERAHRQAAADRRKCTAIIGARAANSRRRDCVAVCSIRAGRADIFNILYSKKIGFPFYLCVRA